jgi:hypothetical protein
VSISAQAADEDTVQYTATELHRRTSEVLHDVRSGKTVEVTFGQYREVQAVVVRPERVTA